LHLFVSGIAKKINVSGSQAGRIIHEFIREDYLDVIPNHRGYRAIVLDSLGTTG
jgi:hypothetical protein